MNQRPWYNIISEARYISLLIKLWHNAGTRNEREEKFIQVKFEKTHTLSRIEKPRLTTSGYDSDGSGCRIAREKRPCKKKVDAGYRRCTSTNRKRIRRTSATALPGFIGHSEERESVILWTQMRRCLRVGHLSRVSREREKGPIPNPLYACRWCPLCNEAQPSQYWLRARLMDLPRMCV